MDKEKCICNYCGKEYCKKGIGTHIWRNHTEEGKKFDPNKGYKYRTRVAWNKGLTKETDERVRKGGKPLVKDLKTVNVKKFLK